MNDEIDKLITQLATLKSKETKAVRIERTALKQWQKSKLLRRGYQAPDKWKEIAKTYESKE